MMATFPKIVLSLTIIFATNFLLTGATVTATTKFDSYIGIADKLTIPGDRLRVYQAVWGEICADGASNLTQVQVFYDALLKGINSTKIEEQQQTAELSASVRDVLINDNARLLAETLNNNKSQDVLQVTRFHEQLFRDFDVELLTAIFEKAIDLAYPFHSTDELYNMLDAIDLKLNFFNYERIYKVRVNWTLYLYWKFVALGDINEKYVFYAALGIHNLKKNQNMYKTLPHDTVRRIDMAFDTFTSSLRHLFNTTNICLQNQNFFSYYLYFPVSSIGSSSSIQAVLRSANFGHTVWRNRYASPNIAAIPDQFYLSYEANDWMLYRRVTDRYMIVQRDSSLPANRWWTPSLRNDNIMFENLGYYMCATAENNNVLQGFNVKAIKPTSLDDPLCQWSITNCSEI